MMRPDGGTIDFSTNLDRGAILLKKLIKNGIKSPPVSFIKG
jgi:hypothetical protein